MDRPPRLAAGACGQRREVFVSDICARLRECGERGLSLEDEAAGEIEQLRRDVKAADIKNDELRGRLAAAHALIEERDLEILKLKAEKLELENTLKRPAAVCTGVSCGNCGANFTEGEACKLDINQHCPIRGRR